ncbi:MAG: hypothetical protein ACJAYE_003625, partial [Candidatus Azotimanducaceae bacterium]
MKILIALILLLPLSVFAAEHGGKPAQAKEHAGEAAPSKEHAGEAAKEHAGEAAA